MSKAEQATYQNILNAAKDEFLEKGFLAASLRNIVKNANVTTGAFYGYFNSKAELFEALVKPDADYLMNLFLTSVEDWENLSSEDKLHHMTELSGTCMDLMIDYIYDHYDNFKILLYSSDGTIYKDFIHNIVEEETASTFRCADVLREIGYDVPEIDKDLCHMLSSGLFSAMFEIVAHDMDKEAAKKRVKLVKDFYTAGWGKIMNFNFG